MKGITREEADQVAEFGGGQAFPSDARSTYFPGLTKRDYFAAAALQGFLANPDFEVIDAQVAYAAYAVADVMLEARK